MDAKGSLKSPDSYSEEDERNLKRKIDLRILPASIIIYLLCFLDR